MMRLGTRPLGGLWGLGVGLGAEEGCLMGTSMLEGGGRSIFFLLFFSSSTPRHPG